jgi:hypothetical protein
MHCWVGLIVWRIWSIDRANTKFLPSFDRTRLPQRSLFSRVIRIVVESALLYTTLVLITFGTQVAGSNALYDTSDVVRFVLYILHEVVVN